MTDVAIHRYKMLDYRSTRDHVPELNETLKAEVEKHWPFKREIADREVHRGGYGLSGRIFPVRARASPEER